MKTISRYIMTLALLLTAVTGAWADGTVTVTEIKASEMPTSWENNNNPVKATDLPGFTAVTRDEAKALGAPADEGEFYVFYTISNNLFIGLYWNNGVLNDTDGEFGLGTIYALKDFFKYYYTGTAEPATTVAWDASTKTGTFAMPGSDVVLTPIYANAATFATTGTGSEANLPAAAEGVIAGTDAPLIADGTGIVANIGSTETAQGTLMYAIGTSDTQAPALTAFSPAVPTAENVADDGADVYVWYYIQGTDAPKGVAATLDNTFDDTEPACLTVQVLTNKFDITLNAANANTIEAGKATVTVGGTDKTATVTDGKLQGVKMGSEVKLKAATGYKFRKVEVKKKGAGPLAAAFKDGAKFKVGYKWNNGNTTYLEFTNSGGTYSLTSVSGINTANEFNSSTLTVKNGNVLALDVVCYPEGEARMDYFCAQIEFDATSSTYKYSSKGSYVDGIISVSVNDADITSQLTEAN